MHSPRLATFAVAIVALSASVALANENENTPTRNLPAGEDSVRRGVQGPAGMFDVRIFLDINLSKDRAGKPVSLAPDIYYSVSDALQIGLLHTLPMGWQTLPGTGLCLSGKDSGCPHVYNNIGFDLMYAHCQKESFTVAALQSVRAGQQLCSVGQTGDATGPHLHLEMWVGGWQAAGGHPIDPLPYLQAWERR